MITEICITLLTIFIVLFIFITYRYTYWQRLGITCVKAQFPYGSVKKCLLLEKNIGLVLAEFYSKYKNEKYVGFYAPLKPMLLIRDPELIKIILVKDFNNFHNNGFEASATVDPLLGYNPFAVKGLHEWKQSRAINSPLMVANKLKLAIPDMAKVAENFIKYLSSKQGKPVEMKETSRFFTIDAVTGYAYGIESNSFFGKEHSSFKEYTSGELFAAGSEANYASLSCLFIPFLAKIFRWRTMSVKVEKFFTAMARTTMQHRISTGQNRNDLIQHLMTLDERAEKENRKPFSDPELAAHCMTIFIDGVETASVLLTFALFELAANPDIQEKLREEIQSVASEPADVDFDKLWALNYLDMVINETLRKYPPVNVLSRICTHQTRLDEKLVIFPGTKIFIPLFGLQRDPKYFPDPEKFQPERFTKENRAQLNKFVFLPFGDGPRICLGFRFALTEMKMAILAVMLKFRITLADPCRNKNTLQEDNDSIFLTLAKENVNIIFTPL